LAFVKGPGSLTAFEAVKKGKDRLVEAMPEGGDKKRGRKVPKNCWPARKNTFTSDKILLLSFKISYIWQC
jgi:hypothetical protein